MSRTILVATDGRPSADGALRLARTLSQQLGAVLETVAVLSPLEFSALSVADSVPAGYTLLEENRARDLGLAVKEQLARVTGSADASHVQVVAGSPAASIAAHAMVLNASLVVLGEESPVMAQPWTRGELVLELIRVSPVPVLVVPADENRLPSRVLAAVDFGPLSSAAARAAAALMQPGGHLYLFHSTWPATETSALPSLSGWKNGYDRRAEARLDALARELQTDLPGRVETMLAHGDAASDLLSAADRLDVDLVASGSQGNGLSDPRLVGRIAATLIRRGRWGVLLTPPSAR